MDKYDHVLDIIEHPENYTSEQLAEILSDQEARAIYNLLCKTESAIKASGEPDVDAEWERFSQKSAVSRRRSFLWAGSRAASIVAIVATSIVAVAAGIAVTVSVTGHRPGPVAAEPADAPAAVSMLPDTVAGPDDTLKVVREPMMFEDEALEEIMRHVADAYGVEILFNNHEAAGLHLYYRLDPSLPLNEVVDQLNTFERIDIRLNGNTLTID